MNSDPYSWLQEGLWASPGMQAARRAACMAGFSHPFNPQLHQTIQLKPLVHLTLYFSFALWKQSKRWNKIQNKRAFGIWASEHLVAKSLNCWGVTESQQQAPRSPWAQAPTKPHSQHKVARRAIPYSPKKVPEHTQLPSPLILDAHQELSTPTPHGMKPLRGKAGCKPALCIMLAEALLLFPLWVIFNFNYIWDAVGSVQALLLPRFNCSSLLFLQGGEKESLETKYLHTHVH